MSPSKMDKQKCEVVRISVSDGNGREKMITLPDIKDVLCDDGRDLVVPNDYSNVGFCVCDDNDMKQLRSEHANLISGFTEASGDICEVLHCGEQIELWFYDDGGEICESYAEIGYQSSCKMEITPMEWINGEGYVPYILRVDSPLSPLNVTVPSAGLNQIELGEKCVMNIVLLPQELTVYTDSDEYYAASRSHMAAESIIPCGTFSPDHNPGFEPSATAIINGIVQSWCKRTNPLDGLDYYELEISCMGEHLSAEHLTVVADPEFFAQLPQLGNVLQGVFWLTGRIVDDEEL